MRRKGRRGADGADWKKEIGLIYRWRETERGGTYIGGAHDATNLLHRVQIGAETSVHGENLLVDDSGDR